MVSKVQLCISVIEDNRKESSLGGEIRLSRNITSEIYFKIDHNMEKNIDFSMWEKCEQMKFQEGTIKIIKGVNEMINGCRLKNSMHLIWWKD